MHAEDDRKSKYSCSSPTSFREEKGREQRPETSKSTSRQRSKSSRNPVLQSHKEVGVTGLEEHTTTVLDKILSSYVSLLCFEKVWTILKSSRGY